MYARTFLAAQLPLRGHPRAGARHHLRGGLRTLDARDGCRLATWRPAKVVDMSGPPEGMDGVPALRCDGRPYGAARPLARAARGIQRATAGGLQQDVGTP